MTIRQELIDELLQERPNPQKLLREGGLLKELTKALVERCLDAELETDLEDAKRRDAPKSDRRNGHSHKTLKGEFGEVLLEVPRDRNGDFEPQLLKKRQTRLEGFDEKVLALYARSMSVRNIQAQLLELYGAEVSPGLISNVTDGVMEEAKAWQARSLEAVYPIVWFDALVVKVRENNRVINKAIHLALGANLTGTKELLGLWIAQAEGAKFWLGVLTELKNRGVQDVLIACIDGLSGFAEAIETVYPDTRVQLCMVQLVRNSLRYVCYKHRKEVTADLKLIYTAATNRSRAESGAVCREMGHSLSHHQQELAKPLAASDSDVCFSPGHSSSHLHY